MRTRSTDHKVRLPRLAAVFLGCVVIACGCAEDRGSQGVGISPLDLSAPPIRIADVEPDVPAPQDDDPPPPVEDPIPPPVELLPPETSAKGGQGSGDPQPSGPDQSGPHVGEHFRLEVEIIFSRSVGETVTDETGTHYYVDGAAAHEEEKVYPSEYWGTFPLYFFDTEVGVTVTLRNLGPRAKVKARVRTEAYVLLTDGTNGAMLAEPQEIDVEVTRDETVTIDASFTAEYTIGMESGLDRFVVKVLHPNESDVIPDGEADEDPALITMEEGIICPPGIELFAEEAF